MFENEQKLIIDSLASSDASKSWIVVGPQGIGKEVFAKNIAQHLTQNFGDYNPYVMWISCGLTDASKKEIQKAILAGEQIEEKEWSKKTEITVDDVREGCHFLSLKSDKIKVLIFNLADEMNENAQNALLKTLEEPYPNTLILLLCENVGKLAPTILSRCQKVQLLPPNRDVFQKQLRQKYPNLSEKEQEEIAFLSNHILGLADQLIAQDGLILWARLKELLVSKTQLNAKMLLAFAEQVAKDKEVYSLMVHLILKLLSLLAKQQASISLEKAYLLSQLYETTQTAFAQIENMNLDKKQSLISIIYKITEVL